MKVISKNSFSTDGFEVFSKSYKCYENNGAFVKAEFLLTGLEQMSSYEDGMLITSLLERLKVKAFFSFAETTTPVFENAPEYNVSENLKDDTLFLELSNLETIGDIYIYLKFYDGEEEFMLSYKKVFSEHIVSSGEVLTNNFVDLRFTTGLGTTPTIQNQLEFDNSLSSDNLKDRAGYHYISDLFYSFGKEQRVNCFFGVDQKGYFLNNIPIPFLKKDEEFQSYLENNNFIINAVTTVFDPETCSTHDVDVSLSPYALGGVFGTLYESSFTLLENFNSSKEIKFDATCVLEDAISKYIIEVAQPQLKKEYALMNSFQFSSFISVPRESIFKTLSLAKALYREQFGDDDDKFVIFDNSPQISVDNELAAQLLTINKTIYEILNTAVEIKNPIRKAYNTTISLHRNYTESINFSHINNGAQVMFFNNAGDSTALPSLSREMLLRRGQEEVQKFFGEAEVQSYKTLSGHEVSINLLNNSFMGLTAQNYIVNQETALENNKALNYSFNYDAFLEYIQAINKIISKNIEFNLHTPTTALLESVTPQEYLTERASEGVTTLLNSLTVTQIPELKTERERRDYLTSLTNVVKTFSIPSTLTTNVCVDNKSQVSDDFVIQHPITPQKALGNNILAFSVLNGVEGFANKEFYDFYKAFIKKELDFSSLPIQSLFLYNYYNGESQGPSFLNKDNLLRQFAVYGIIYFMFKSLFRIKIFLPDENTFVNLDQRVLSSLNSNFEYLCRVDQYTNAPLGIKVPKLLRTSIYNRYFVLNTQESPSIVEEPPVVAPTVVPATPVAETTITY